MKHFPTKHTGDAFLWRKNKPNLFTARCSSAHMKQPRIIVKYNTGNFLQNASTIFLKKEIYDAIPREGKIHTRLKLSCQVCHTDF